MATPGRWPSANCAQRVTPGAMADDNQTDAGDVGTPELTSPRLHLPRFPAGQGPPGGIARAAARRQYPGTAPPGSVRHMTATTTPEGGSAGRPPFGRMLNA